MHKREQILNIMEKENKSSEPENTLIEIENIEEYYEKTKWIIDALNESFSKYGFEIVQNFNINNKNYKR